ncbi:hypothetical protein Cfor_08800 [Coptotermes formosanus]|uniref:Uncharacterized protein n=1 Tax=Coptotermes formosanus TaxID=36987 RepID=A0A6L2Q796_COPFO|nr:hypothetical protein Cfor_08800 [Coptotermes formosanus]
METEAGLSYIESFAQGRISTLHDLLLSVFTQLAAPWRWLCLDQDTMLSKDVLLADEQKERVTTGEDFFQLPHTSPYFLNCIFTGEESWAFRCDTETERQIMERRTKSSLRPKIFRLQK